MGNFICVAKGLSISKLSPQAKPSPQINRTVPTNLQAAPAKEVGEAGKKTPIFPAGKVAIWIAQQDKFMAALRWFLPRGNSRIEILFA